MNVVDTVGCGDSFVAAIAFGYIHNMQMVSTLAFGNAVGAATAMGCGAGRNVATLDQVIKLMRASHLNDDEAFWNQILGEHLGGQEVTMLAKAVTKRSNDRPRCVSLQSVVSELLPMLESARLEGTVPS